MTTANITKRAVDAAKARKTDSYLWDRELHGFGLKVTPAARKVYLVQYRLGGRKGRTRRVTIGQHGSPWTPTAARTEAKRLLGEVDAGRDPALERDKAKAARTVAAVFKQFVNEHVGPKLKASTAESYQRVANLYILPSIGRRSIAEVARQDIAKLHHELRSKPYQANWTLAALSKFFYWVEKHGLRPDQLDDVRLHDLRHSFASVAASGGQSLVIIGKMLGHSQPATTARYAHLADDPVKAASVLWGGTLRRQWIATRAAAWLIYRDRGEQRPS